MLTEMQEHLNRPARQVRTFLKRNGIEPDPDISKCGHVGYLRAAVTGLRWANSPDWLAAKKVLLKALDEVLRAARQPIPSRELFQILHKRGIRLGPLDSLKYLERVLWENRDRYVNIRGLGRWLRERPYARGSYDGSTDPEDQAERIGSIIADLLAEAPHPMSIPNMLDALADQRIDTRSGAKAQWLARIVRGNSEKIVRLVGFGYWLKSRPYAPAFFDGCGNPKPQHVRIGNAVVELIARARRPMSLSDIIAAIEQNGMSVRSAKKEQWVRNLLIKNYDKVVKLTGFGYWSKSRAYPPALYDPDSNVPRSQADRLLGFLKGHLAQAKRPASLRDLLQAIKNHGIEIRSSGPEALVRNALGKDNAFIYLRGHGHWLRAHDYPPANYGPLRDANGPRTKARSC